MIRRLLVRGAVAVWSTLALVATFPGVAAAECPEGGHVRFGIEPYEASTRLLPVYDSLSKLLAAKIGCPVDIFITPSYNAEIEAMRGGKLDVGEFGPLGYVFAHEIAGADVFATYNDQFGKPSTYYASIVSWTGSGVTNLKDRRLGGRRWSRSTRRSSVPPQPSSSPCRSRCSPHVTSRLRRSSTPSRAR